MCVLRSEKHLRGKSDSLTDDVDNDDDDDDDDDIGIN